MSDLKHPKQIGEINMPTGTHSHKGVSGDIMITNREVLGAHALKKRRRQLYRRTFDLAYFKSGRAQTHHPPGCHR
jgi:hypothetical protein